MITFWLNNVKKRSSALLLLWCLGLFSVFPVFAVDEEAILVDSFSIYSGSTNEQLIAEIQFDYQLTDYLRDSLQNGITLSSSVSFRLNWHSEWWFNNEELFDRIDHELKYQALSSQYQLIDKKTGENWNFPNIAAALVKLGSIHKHALPILPDRAFEGDVSLIVQASIEPKASEVFGIHSKLSSLWSGNKNRIVSQEVLWPLTH